MTIESQTAAMLAQFASSGAKPFYATSPQEARIVFSRLMRMLPPSRAEIGNVENLDIEGPAGPLPLRIYRPNKSGVFPILVYFHGGAFVACDLDTHDWTCRELCAGAGCILVSVDYRLAPEYKFPSAVNDCLAAARWAGVNASVLGGDPNKIAVGGDSAGGNLAIVTTHRVRDEGGPKFCGQLLAYPVAGHPRRLTTSMLSESAFISKDDVEWWSHLYARNPDDFDNPHFSPIVATDFSGLPPALMITAEHDPLRDDGEMYADKLIAAGVPVVKSRYAGAIHGFTLFGALLEQGKKGTDEACRWLSSRFSDA